MYQIAIGDTYTGFTVVEGHGIGAPFFKATVNFTFSADPIITENIEIELKGTTVQISAALALLDTIAWRAIAYDQGIYPMPQQLRFQTAAGTFYSTPISLIYVGANPAGYLHHYTGSNLAILHYTRPNYFDGQQTQLALTGRSGADQNNLEILNHTDGGAGHGSTALIKKTLVNTALPAPMRVVFTSKSTGVSIKNIMLGLYHHATYDDDPPFFIYSAALTGGTNHADAAAISGNFRRFAWTNPAWVTMVTFPLSAADLVFLNGLPFRPVMRLFTNHAYTDLYFKITIDSGGYPIYTSDAVHSPAGVGYVTLPAVDLPPNFLLNEVPPYQLTGIIKVWRESGAASTVELDCITLMPLAYGATFYGYSLLKDTMIFIDDSSVGRYNIRFAAAAGESMGFTRVGGDLLLPPGQNSRLFFHATTHTDLMSPTIVGDLNVFYYPRIRLL